MKRILFDCDNTLGLENRDVDDALALLYLLGREDVEVCGVTTSFGNDGQAAVFRSTRRLLDDWRLADLPLKRGAESVIERGSSASRFLCSCLGRKDPEADGFVVLATGSLSNLWAVHQVDSRSLGQAEAIVVMGGVIEPLLLGNAVVEELNFTVDPEASYGLLSSGVPMTVITGNLCLQAFLGEERLHAQTTGGGLAHETICDAVLRWHRYFRNQYGIPGFYAWDVAAAVFVTEPDLFESRRCLLRSEPSDLERGFLDLEDCANGPLNVPRRITDIDAFWALVERGWQRGASCLFGRSEGWPSSGRLSGLS